jgi:hypothetical protein
MKKVDKYLFGKYKEDKARSRKKQKNHEYNIYFLENNYPAGDVRPRKFRSQIRWVQKYIL